MTTNSKYDIWAQETRNNPFPLYKKMREQDPAFRVIDHLNQTVWFFTRYEDCVTMLKDMRVVRNVKNLPTDVIQARQANLPPDELPLEALQENLDGGSPGDFPPLFEVIDQHMNNQDPPDHTRLRQLIHKAFTPKRIRDLQPRIEKIADDLLDAMSEKMGGDLIADYAFLLPITVILEMLGVPVSDRNLIHRWTQALAIRSEESAAAVVEYVAYMTEVIEDRRQKDKGDILSALVHAQIDDDKLNHSELLSTIFILMLGGHETTTSLIANSALTLLGFPEQLEQLRSNPRLIHNTIEEVLRFQGPVDGDIQGWAAEPIEWLDGRVIDPGDLIIPILLAANRDPEVFEEPDSFDIRRDPNPHIAFGKGIHYCLGAPLARLEGAIAVTKLVERFPNLRLNTDPKTLQWGPDIIFRNLSTLPLCYQ